ncbi:vitamin K epoxide reductase family protein [Mucilaginibacter auburnensis]|uniref:Peptidase C39-like protein n=1 Tax=Mucilaginibacter auburnensis TaxID=1457233 RepID=A0A2H9VUF4_9SPHI|nr:vitamin K epoxide reductase family protein [Mucilaginibacter auburnensis]PJJ84438.1 peptidase C39-like protein [Mucilaginibacter auburnensis]
MQRDNFTMALSHFIAALAIPLSRHTLDEDLQKHPDYSSLLAMSDVMNLWNIPNAAYNLTFDELIAEEINVPFIAFVSKKEFLTVNNLTEKYAIVSNERWTKHRISIDEFKNIYSGAILIAEKNDTSGESDYAAKRFKDIINDIRLPFVIASATSLLLIWLIVSPYFGSLNLQVALLTLFKTAGLAITTLLLVQGFDANNPLIHRICGSDSDKNCNAILSSKAAKVNEYLNWSEVGFFYFSGTWLVLLFNSDNPSIIHLLSLFNLLSLPYTFYSIYHQWRVSKQWCRLCCAVQLLLWFEFFAFFPSLSTTSQTFAYSEWVRLITTMAVPVLSWIFIKPYLLLSQQISPLKKQLREYKYNRDHFNRMLNDEAQYALLDNCNSIILGNPEAEKVITMVSNPFCEPCSRAHKALEWIESRDDVKLQIIFISQNENDRNAKVALHLMAIKKSKESIAVKNAIDDWYEQKQKNYDEWAKVHPQKGDAFGLDSIVKQREWCNLTNVTSTPTLFLNGRKLPQNYLPEDIKYFI